MPIGRHFNRKPKKEMRFNPLCDMFPPLSDEAFKELVADIEENGQRVGIQLDAEKRVLDGKHRYKALLIARQHRPPWFIKWKGEATEEAYIRHVCSLNIQHRHLTAAQRADLVVKMTKKLTGGRPKSTSPCATSPAVDEIGDAVSGDGLSKEQQAEIAKVGTATIDRARARAEPKPKAETVFIHKDNKGNVLPDEIAAVFAQREFIDEFKSRIDSLRRDVTDTYKTYPKVMHFLADRRQRTDSDLKQLAWAFRSGAPYCLCPKCVGHPFDRKSCLICDRQGWLTQTRYDSSVPGELKW